MIKFTIKLIRVEVECIQKKAEVEDSKAASSLIMVKLA